MHFSGDANASYERHVLFDHVVEPEAASLRERFEAVARSLRDLLVPRWLKTGATYDRANPKHVYYLSMEFLIGRSLTNNLTNLLVEPIARDVLQREGLDLVELAEQEPDAGLGNGGLGRLAACFLDEVWTRFPGDGARVVRMSMFEEAPVKQVRMAHLAMASQAHYQADRQRGPRHRR